MNQVPRSAKLLTISQIVRLGLQLLSVTILSRLSKPEYYSIVALSSSVMALISLAIHSLIVALLYQAWVLKLNDWRPSLKAFYESISAMFGFSAKLAGFNLINYFSRIDVFIVCKILRTTAMELYSTSVKLMPLQTMKYVSNRALFSVLSQLQHDQKASKNAYFSALVLDFSNKN